jgi:hypothetical protein
VYAGNSRELSQEEIAARQFIWTRAAAMSAQERTSLYQNALRQGDEATRRAFETAPSALGLLSDEDRKRGLEHRRKLAEAEIPNLAATRDRLSFETWTTDTAERHVQDVLRAVDQAVLAGMP